MACWPHGLGFLPVLFSLMLSLTVGVSYLIAVRRGDVPAVFPYISETSARPPESCVFAQFVNLTALILLAVVYIRYKAVDTIEGLPPQRVRCLNIAGFILGLAATFGLSLVGNFQETNVLVVHDIGAITLFVCFSIYAMVHTRISYLLCPEYTRLYVCRLRFCILLLMLVSLVTSSTCQGIASVEWSHHHNKTDIKHFWKPRDGGYRVHLVSTSFEWVLTGSLALFCLTFVGEFRKVSLVFNMFQYVEPFPDSGLHSEAEPDEYTKLYTY